MRSIILRIGLIFSLFTHYGKNQASIILKKCKINAVMERKDSNCVGILSDQGKLKLFQNSLNIYLLLLKKIVNGN